VEALRTVGLPAVLKPADSAGQRGISLLRTPEDLATALALALDESSSGEAFVESFHEGREINGLFVARRGEPELVMLSDRIRPDGVGFGVALVHVYPSTLDGAALDEVARVAASTVRAVGLRDGVAYPQLLVTNDGAVLLLEVAARVPAGQMDQVARLGVGIDLIEIAVRQALGEELANGSVRPRLEQPLRAGTVRRVGGLAQVRSSPGVVDVQLFLAPGDAIRPVRVDGDRKGFVIAVGESSTEALARARTAADLIDVEVD
jgi:biotin carboxylase